jgi:alginate O-acetyltransferase complex protein AlgI
MAATFGRRQYRSLAANFSYQMAARGLTFAWFSLSLFCFWADWEQLKMISASVGVGGALASFFALSVVAAIAYAAYEALMGVVGPLWSKVESSLVSRYARTVYATTMVTIVLCTVLLLTQSAPTIVYEKF